MAGIYIHIPFCQTKCRYCDFYSITNIRQSEGFVKALKVELTQRSYELGEETVDTIYMGGGTPSMLTSSQIVSILELLNQTYPISDEAEITMECNPGDLSGMDIQEIVSAGVNRISIGAQSFQPEVLHFLSRRHDVEETKEMYRDFRNAGISNISLDLMYGIPGTTTDTVAEDLAEILSLRPEHISAYHLIYEEGTPLWQDLLAGKVSELDEEESLKMNHLVRSMLTRYGYEHYEISNFALHGYRSRHNSSYWKGTPYLGFGPSAHSYVHPWRSWNPSDLNQYSGPLLHGAHFLNRSYEEITPDLEYEEYILTHLRTSDGVDVQEILQRFGSATAAKAEVLLKQYVGQGLMIDKEEVYTLTEAGIDLSDGIMASFF